MKRQEYNDMINEIVNENKLEKYYDIVYEIDNVISEMNKIGYMPYLKSDPWCEMYYHEFTLKDAFWMLADIIITKIGGYKSVEEHLTWVKFACEILWDATRYIPAYKEG